jgi:hypothetical protein
VQPGDPDILQVDYTVAGYYIFDEALAAGVASAFTAQFGCQIRIVKPSLSIVRAGPGSVAISWPAPAVGYQLQQSSDSGRTWTPVTDSPALGEGTYSVTMESSDMTCRFYRLMKP